MRVTLACSAATNKICSSLLSSAPFLNQKRPLLYSLTGDSIAENRQWRLAYVCRTNQGEHWFRAILCFRFWMESANLDEF
jgi:hypothetical protein